jgi:hypothetical protein
MRIAETQGNLIAGYGMGLKKCSLFQFEKWNKFIFLLARRIFWSILGLRKQTTV